LVNPYGNPAVSFYGSSSAPLKSNAAFTQAVHAAKADFGATGYAYGEFNLFTTNYSTWYAWFQNALHDDPDCMYQALYNYGSMCGKPSVEQAMLDAMSLYPTSTPSGRPSSWRSTDHFERFAVTTSSSISVKAGFTTAAVAPFCLSGIIVCLDGADDFDSSEPRRRRWCP
jgi:hypothetical protein